MTDPLFFTAIGLFIVALVSPGPSVFAIMTTGMTRGRPAALALNFGIVVGSCTWGMVALFGFAGIMHTMGHALVLLKIIGATYLLWLAFKAFRSAMKSDAALKANPPRGGHVALFLNGLALHLTNPKAAFGWLATISIGVPVNAGFSHAALLVLVCIVLMILFNTSLAIAFSTRSAIGAYERARRTIQAVSGGVFALAGTALLADAARR